MACIGLHGMSSSMQYRGRDGGGPSTVPGVVAADLGESGSSDSNCEHHQHSHAISVGTSGGGGHGSGNGSYYPSSASSAVDASYRQAEERAERRRRRAASRQQRGLQRPPPSVGGGLNRYRSRRARPGGRAIDSDAIARMMLIGFFLFLLCTVAMFRALLSGNTAAASDNGGAMDDLQLPPEHNRHHSGPANSLRKSNNAEDGPYQYDNSENRNQKKKRRGGLMNRVNSAASWLSNLPFGGSQKTYPPPSADSMKGIGDKTKRYYDLRRQIDQTLPLDMERTKRRVREELRVNTYEPIKPDELPYTVTNCPLYPPEGYPYAWPVIDIVQNWPPDDTNPRPKIYQGICVFDYETEMEKAKIYREAEVPFVVRDDPQVLRTAERWNHPGYMLDLMSDTPHRTEYSPDNHFMYWMAENPSKKKQREKRGQARHPKFPTPPEGWKPPTKMMRMPYEEWLGHANTTDDKLGPDNPHWYYRLIGCGAQGRCDKDSSEYLFDELPFFQPRDGQLFIVEPHRQKGIHCRFGMKGVIAENHFDGR